MSAKPKVKVSYDNCRCKAVVFDKETGEHRQCSRPGGHGKHNHYCGHHAKTPSMTLGIKAKRK